MTAVSEKPFEKMQLLPVILAGGGGTRLWPLSREQYPKQFLTVIGEHSLLQDTLLRVEDFEGADTPPLIICNEEHRFLVVEQAAAVSRHPERVILEPVGRNTAPALTVASLDAQSRYGDAVLVMMPADHFMPDGAPLAAAVAQGLDLAMDDYLVTFGISPLHPETGYGYIKSGAAVEGYEPAKQIDRFVEKPDQATAQQYITSGGYLWNSGIFMMKASVWLDAIERCRADILHACQAAYSSGAADSVFFRLDAAEFENCPDDSVDYAVMEPASESSEFSAAVVPLQGGWSDVGSWESLWAISAQDEQGNVVSGDVHTRDAKGNLIYGDHRLVAAIGCEDLVVVETADAVLVAPKSQSQDVKTIVAWLREADRTEGRLHRRVYRPWGSYESIDAGERFQVKRLTVNPGQQLSLQLHHQRAEHWIVVKGTAQVVCGDKEFLLAENESTYIPIETKHRLSNPGTIPLEVIEVQSGSYLGEDDIVRFEDIYDRHKS